uniref:C-type lectin domain-containing protein n=1 Tax=Chelydra serpentina TaxID=8475 RepID=A0A8C3SY79_CHESE
MGKPLDYTKGQAYWIGAHDTFKEGSFMWTDGSKYNFKTFGAGQPDGLPGENYVASWILENGGSFVLGQCVCVCVSVCVGGCQMLGGSVCSGLAHYLNPLTLTRRTLSRFTSCWLAGPSDQIIGCLVWSPALTAQSTDLPTSASDCGLRQMLWRKTTPDSPPPKPPQSKQKPYLVPGQFLVGEPSPIHPDQ